MTISILADVARIAATQFFTNLLFPGGAATPNAKGNAFQNGNIVPFARGGVVNKPTIFPMAQGAGLMGEAGPEAIMPLKRTASGDLGVQASPVNVTINNLAPGVAVKQRSDSSGLTIDVVLETIAGSIRRGGNDVANALEESYSIGRGRAVY
jgi:phage-related minor tail protein